MFKMDLLGQDSFNELVSKLERTRMVYVQEMVIVQKGNEHLFNFYKLIVKVQDPTFTREYKTFYIRVSKETLIKLWDKFGNVEAKNFMCDKEKGLLKVLTTVDKRAVNMDASDTLAEEWAEIPEAKNTFWDYMYSLGRLGAMITMDDTCKYVTDINATKFSKSTMTVYNSFFTDEGWKSKKIMWYTDDLHMEEMCVLIPVDKTSMMEYQILEGQASEVRDVEVAGSEYKFLKVDTSALTVLTQNQETLKVIYCKEILIRHNSAVQLMKAMLKGIDFGETMLSNMINYMPDKTEVKVEDRTYSRIVQSKNLIIDKGSTKFDYYSIRNRMESEEMLKVLKEYILQPDNKELRNIIVANVTQVTSDHYVDRAFAIGFATGFRYSKEENKPAFKINNATRAKYAKGLFNFSIELHKLRMNLFMYELPVSNGHLPQTRLTGGEFMESIIVVMEGY